MSENEVSPEFIAEAQEIVDALNRDLIAVENGLQALRVLPSEKFDLIVTDINMPNINGLELLAFVKKNPNHENTPVLVVTTEGAEKDREKGLALGASMYLVKPFERDELLAAVRKLLDGES